MIVRFCILLASKSPSAYNEIRDPNTLVLPSRRTLWDYRNAIHPKVGFNPDVIDELKNVTKNLFICLCFDEIKVRSSLVFNKYTDELIGFIELGDSDTNYSTLSDLDKLASHILVYYVRGFVLTWSLHLHILQHTVLHLSRKWPRFGKLSQF